MTEGDNKKPQTPPDLPFEEPVESAQEVPEELPEEQEFFDAPPVETPPDAESLMGPSMYPFDAESAEMHKRETEMLGNVQYILEPHLPEDPKLRKEFQRYEMLISKNLALANITREDVYMFVDYFDVIILLLKAGQPKVAVKRMGRLLMILQLTRSVGFGERIAQTAQRQIMEQAEPRPVTEQDIKKRKKRFGII